MDTDDTDKREKAPAATNLRSAGLAWLFLLTAVCLIFAGAYLWRN